MIARYRFGASVLVTSVQALVILLVLPPVPAYAERAPDEPWKEFVSVAGQPEPVPAQWVATPEGRFAHSIVVPNPVPKDSGYRWWMSSERYFEHLCKTEAGEFIFKTVDNVEGFYFARPPKRPTDSELMARYTLEAPEIERTFQLMPDSAKSRARTFVSPPWALYRFVEEPNASKDPMQKFVRARANVQGKSKVQIEYSHSLQSRYALIWRGVMRRAAREHEIAGSEWIVVDLSNSEVLALHRNYARTGGTPNAPGGIWWLNAVRCPSLSTVNIFSKRFYDFTSKVLRPIAAPEK